MDSDSPKLVPDVSPAQIEEGELVKRLRKLRWIGMDEEAKKLQRQAAGLEPALTGVLSEPCCTD